MYGVISNTRLFKYIVNFKEIHNVIVKILVCHSIELNYILDHLDDCKFYLKMGSLENR